MQEAPMEPIHYIKQLFPKLITLRRYLHQHPELGFEEYNTNKFINKILSSLNEIEIIPQVANTGVIAKINVNKQYKTLAFRADIDALPIQDKKEVTYKSLYEGFSHSCGHDVHTTILLGTILTLIKYKNQLRCNLIFIFQPAEEGPGGAKPILEFIQPDQIDMILGLHVLPHLPTGYIAASEGLSMGASTKININLCGEARHIAESTHDENLIYLSSELLILLKNAEKTFKETHKDFLFSVGTINGGYYYNTTADEVTITGTIRSFSHQTNKSFFEYIKNNITNSHLKTLIPKINIDFENMYPPLYNDNKAIQLIKASASKVLGTKNIVPAWKVLGADDFSFYTEKIKGGYFWLGTHKYGEIAYDLHSPYFDVDENCIFYGTLVLSQIALDYF
ncbi:hypothetical protein COI83_26185 [Bacillus cereus]|nr:hypothetical protein COI83_26185 [Bacillus cereus]